MGDYLFGEKLSTTYQQVVAIGGAADRAGIHATTQKIIWTDDGAGGTNLFPFTAARDAMQFTGTQRLEFNDDGVYIYSSTDGQLNLVADGEIDLTGGTLDINSSGVLNVDGTAVSIDGTSASNFTVTGGNLTLSTVTSGEMFLTPVNYIQVASGKKLQFADSGEYISGDTTNLTLGSGADILLTATADVNIPQGVGLSFATDDAEKIESDGTDLTVNSGGKLNLTATSDVHIPKNIGLVFDDNASEKIESNNTDLTVNSGADINLTATSDINIPASVGLTFGSAANPKIEGDGTDLAIDVAGNINVTSTVNEANSIYLRANAGASETIKIHADQGTAVTEGAASVSLLSDAGGVELRSTANLANAINLTVDSGTTSSMTLFNATGTSVTEGSASIQLLSDAGGIGIKSTSGLANAILLTADGGTSETIKLHADQGTGAASIELTSDAGGIGINTTAAGKTLDINTAILDIDATEASNLTMTANTGSTQTLTVSALNEHASYSGDLLLNADGKVHIRSDVTTDSYAGAGIQIGTDLSGVDVAIGHTTSDVRIGDDLTVTGDITTSGLTATGSVSIGSVTYSAEVVSGTAPTVTYTNTSEENSDLTDASNSAAGRQSRMIYKGEKSDGTVHELATVVVGHQGTSDDKKGQMQFYVNSGALSDGALLNAMNILDTGYVGINTLSPAKPLESFSASTSQLRLTFADASKFCDFTVDTNHDITVTPSSTGQIKLHPTTDSVDFFQVLDADGGTPVLNVDSTNERVGIGTASPDQLLEVESSGDAVIHVDSANNAKLELDCGSVAYEAQVVFQVADVSQGSIAYNDDGTSADATMDFNTEGVDVMHISKTGVGIGTTAPAKLLDVVGTTDTVVRIENDDDTAYVATASTVPYSTAQLSINNLGDGTEDGHFAGIGFSIDSANGSGGTSSSRAFIGAIQPDNTNDDTDFVFKLRRHGANPVEMMRINSDGRVGIGTTAPVNTLHVSHNAATNDNGILIVNEQTEILDGELLGAIGFDSSDNSVANIPDSALKASCFIAAYAAEDHSSGDKGGDLTFGCSLINEDYDVASTRHMTILSDGNVGIGINEPTAQVHIDQSSTSGAVPVLKLDQADIDDTFIDFIGTSAADGSRSISSDTTTDSAKFGAIAIEINGTTKWIRIYDDHS